MTNRERIRYMRAWVKELKPSQIKEIECLNYAIKICEKAESKRIAKEEYMG